MDSSDSEDADDLFNEIKTNGSSSTAAKNGNGKHDSSDSKMEDEFDSLMENSNTSKVIIFWNTWIAKEMIHNNSFISVFKKFHIYDSIEISKCKKEVIP